MSERNQQSVTSSRKERILAAAGILTAASGAFAVGYFNPTTAGFFPVCPLHAMTGLNCPGCGMTRGFHALFHGDILSALHFNALLPAFLLVGIYLFISLGLIVIRGRGLSLNILQTLFVMEFFDYFNCVRQS